MALSQISGTTGIADTTITSAKLADFSAAVDLNGVELLLDADQDTSITADTDDVIDFKIAGVEHISLSNSSGDTIIKPRVDAKDIIFQQFDGNKIFCIDDGNFVSVGGNATAPGEIRIYEDTDLGTHYSGFKVGNLTASIAYQLPNADGSNSQVLTTNGSGVLTWATASANTPSSADAEALGSASLEWADLFLADASTIQFGNDQDVILTHVADTGLLLSGTNVIQFNDASQNIGAPTNAILDINATDEIELNATLVDVNANLDVSGTITSGGVITGTAFTAGSAVLAEAELELLDGLTAGTAIASKVVTTDASIDTTGQRNLTISGELDAATLDISGAIDIAGASQFSNTITVGANDQGYDIIIYGDTASANLTWDTSVDDLIFNGAARAVIPDGQLVLGSTAVTSTAAELNLLDNVSGLVQADLTKLAALDATATEINLIDGGTSAGTTAVADADGIITNDGGTMRLTTAATFKTYFQEGISTAYDDLTAGDAAVLITTSSGNITIDAAASDSDIIFKGTDGGADRTYMTIDGSAGGDLFLTGGLIDLKNDGSAVSQIKFYCESSNAHAQTLIGAPHSEAATNTLTLPDGSNGVLLSTVSTATVTNKTLTSPVLNTATVGTSIVPASADGATLGTASAEFSDLYLADGSKIFLGNDQEIMIVHNADNGIQLKHTATADNKPIKLIMQTGETDMAADDVIGTIDFQAPDEGTGTDAILVAAGIEAVAEGDFSSSNNATSLVFKTGASEAAAGKIKVTSAGHLFPMADDSYDLGGASNQWRNIYTGDLHLSNMSKAEGNVVDGTKGDWTIQEGSDELYLMNNNSGKKYKFNLTEV